MLVFQNKILIVGYGAVARSFLSLLFKHVDIPSSNILILDPLPPDAHISSLIASGIRYFRGRLLLSNYEEYLAKLVGPGDCIVQLATGVDSKDLLVYARKNNILYFNTGNDIWLQKYMTTQAYQSAVPYTNALFEMLSDPAASHGNSAVLMHGANCGLVSHFTKAALEDFCSYVIREKELSADFREQLVSQLAVKDHAALSELLGVKAIHVSEKDSQKSTQTLPEEVFYNTWNIYAAASELASKPEVALGTHETQLPVNSTLQNNLYFTSLLFSQKACHMEIISWVPSGFTKGNLVIHEETFTIARYLTRHDSLGGKRYAPTVLFSYQICPHAQEGMKLVAQSNFTALPKERRVVTREISEGADELGVLLLGSPFGSWWTGSVLDIHTARRHNPDDNATVLQVASSLMAAVIWGIEHPLEGIKIPEYIPHETILAFAKPYLGEYISQLAPFSLPSGPQALEACQLVDFF